MKKQSNIAQIAIFFAIMLVIHLLSSVIFTYFLSRLNQRLFIFQLLLPVSFMDQKLGHF